MEWPGHGRAALTLESLTEEELELSTAGSRWWLLSREKWIFSENLPGSGRQDNYKSIILIMEPAKCSRIF